MEIGVRPPKVRPKAVRLPIMELDGYQLLSGVANNERWPDSYPIPPEWLRRALGTRHSAKLVFEIHLPKHRHPLLERMWVNIEGREGPYYAGSLHNQPLCYGIQRRLKRGDRVVFLPEHIVDVLLLSSKIAASSDPVVDPSWLMFHDLEKYGAEWLRGEPFRGCRQKSRPSVPREERLGSHGKAPRL